MKKILNAPADYVDEMLEGLCAAHPANYRQPEPRVIVRGDGAQRGKVGIVTGGGSGHLPVFTGYVGPGLLGSVTQCVSQSLSSSTARMKSSVTRTLRFSFWNETDP